LEAENSFAAEPKKSTTETAAVKAPAVPDADGSAAPENFPEGNEDPEQSAELERQQDA
jgi:hypothetical protein